MSTHTIHLPDGSTCEGTEIAPGEFVPILPSGEPVPLYGVIKMVSVGGGNFQPRVMTWNRMVRLVENTAEQLGLGTLNNRIFRRLAVAGMITTREITPGCLMMDVASLIDHLKAAEDPEFWTPKRRRAYSQACAIVR